MSSYMRWAKTRRPATFDLAGSNLYACSLDDLPGAGEALSLDGTNENGYPPLVHAIAQQYGVIDEQVATGPGASGANFFVCVALLQPGDEVLVERPGYDPLLAVPQALGARIVRFERRFEDGYAIDPDAIRAALTPRTRLIVLTNPHNPTGVRATRAELEAVARVAEKAGVPVLADEVYLDVAAEGDASPAVHVSDMFVSTSSLTKSYGLNALRCGWALAASDVAARIQRARDIVDVIGSIPAERLGALAFAHLDALAARARAIVQPNAILVKEFVENRDDLAWVAPGGATVAFPRLRSGADASAFVENLLARYDTAVVPGRFFEAPAHFRIAFAGARDKLQGGLERLTRALEESRQ